MGAPSPYPRQHEKRKRIETFPAGASKPSNDDNSRRAEKLPPTITAAEERRVQMGEPTLNKQDPQQAYATHEI
jgi:hypothetical protein